MTTSPRGNDPWVLTQSQKTGTRSHGGRSSSTTRRVAPRNSSPNSSGRGAHRVVPMATTRPTSSTRGTRVAARVSRQAQAGDRRR